MPTYNKNLNAISLFCGAGGMDVGFEKAGFTIVLANEENKYACDTYRKNHPNTVLLEGDIHDHLHTLATHRNIDLVFGGPPCQGFSVAGKMANNDTRSQLVFSFCDAIDAVQPQAFVMENVKALYTLSKFESVRKELSRRFKKSGYDVIPHVLNAKDFGISQSRERVFFIGVKKGFTQIRSDSFVPFLKSPVSLRDLLVPLGPPGSPNNQRTCRAKIIPAKKPVLRKSAYAGMLFNGLGRPLNPDGYANTISASLGGNGTPIFDNEHLYNNATPWIETYHQHLLKGGTPINVDKLPIYLRRLTINEAALLQTFPHDYQFCGPDSRVFKQIGNAVPCQLAYVVANVVANTLLLAKLA